VVGLFSTSQAKELASGQPVEAIAAVSLSIAAIPVVIAVVLQWLSFFGSYFYTKRKRYIAVFIYHVVLLLIIAAIAFSSLMFIDGIEGVSVTIS